MKSKTVPLNTEILINEFINLPHLVYEEMVKYMDLDSLKALRATCKTTKFWVETEEILQQFNIHIISSNFLQNELYKSEIKWTSFSFSLTNPFYENIPAMTDFLDKYGNEIKSLNFIGNQEVVMNEYMQPVFWINILESCPNLLSLTMDELDIFKISDPTLKKIIENWKNVETLILPGFKYSKACDMQSEFFANVFTNCLQIRKLHLPRTMYWNGETDFDHDRFIIQPLIDHLLEPEKYLSYLRYLNIHRNDMPNDDKPMIRQLARICADRNITLSGSSSTLQRIINDFEEEDCTDVSRILGTLTSINDNMVFMDFSNLHELSLEYRNISIFSRNYQLPDFPKLFSISFVFNYCHCHSPCTSNPSSYLHFIQKIMQKKRNSVRRFSARVLSPGPSVDLLFLKASDFVNNFRNLSELSLEGWKAKDKEFLELWSGLPNLENVFLQRCLNLTDKGLLGTKKHPGITQLKQLKQLYLSGIPKLNRFYKAGLSRMKLKYFYSSDMKLFHFRSLTKGPFAESIQYFIEPNISLEEPISFRANNCADPEVFAYDNDFRNVTFCKKYLQNFKNLREPNVETWNFEDDPFIIFDNLMNFLGM